MEFLKQIETLFRTGTAGGLTDAQLLDCFLEHRGDDAEAAFATLVDRHGAMVLRVCRQILQNEQDAEDAAQATFLVLAQGGNHRPARVRLMLATRCRAAGGRKGTHRRDSPPRPRAARGKNAYRRTCR